MLLGLVAEHVEIHNGLHTKKEQEEEAKEEITQVQPRRTLRKGNIQNRNSKPDNQCKLDAANESKVEQLPKEGVRDESP